HHALVLTESEMLSSCESALASLDQPSIDGVNTFFISRAVKQAGITVALSGLGGDELFAGYAQFRTLPRIVPWLARWSRAPYAVRHAVAKLSPHRMQQRAKLSAMLNGEYGFSDPHFLSRSLFLPGTISQLLEPEAVRQIDYGGWEARMRQLQERAEGLD